MSVKSLGDPFDADADLIHGAACGCADCKTGTGHGAATALPQTHDAMMERAVESAIVRAVFGQNEFSRRSFAKMLGGGTLAAALSPVFPMDKA
ncbi:MAG: nitrate/nitrite transport system substrate-binding protein [Paracoccaceae bacterium]|jgi:nitrate/nitrite transport system substrate-binding protein